MTMLLDAAIPSLPEMMIHSLFPGMSFLFIIVLIPVILIVAVIAFSVYLATKQEKEGKQNLPRYGDDETPYGKISSPHPSDESKEDGENGNDTP